MVALSKILLMRDGSDLKCGIGMRKAVRTCWQNRVSSNISIVLNFILTRDMIQNELLYIDL
jgi:hypothetical protein